MIVRITHVLTNMTKMKEQRLATHLLSVNLIPRSNCAPVPWFLVSSSFNRGVCCPPVEGAELGTHQGLPDCPGRASGPCWSGPFPVGFGRPGQPHRWGSMKEEGCGRDLRPSCPYFWKTTRDSGWGVEVSYGRAGGGHATLTVPGVRGQEH